MIINHNMSAMYANRQLGLTNLDTAKSIEKLGSGLQINRAADDASGLAVSEKLRSQIRGLNQAERNIQNGISFVQVTEGYLQETQNILQRVRELAIQAANGIYTDEDRAYIQIEVSQLVDEVNRIASHAQFNGMQILDGTRFADGAGLQLQVGANMDQFENIHIGNMSATALGLLSNNEAIRLSTVDEANQAIATLSEALTMVSAQRADLGAFQNRFESAARSVAVASENLQASESRIRDANMASEMVNFSRNTILNQAGTAMLVQANMVPQNIIRLLG